MSYGVTPTGFVKKSLSEISAETEAEYKALLGDDFNLDPNEPAGQEKGIYDEREASLWDLTESLYNMMFVDNSEDVPLDNLVALNNKKRLGAETSKIKGAVVTGTPGKVIPVGFKASVDGNDLAVFETVDPWTIGGGGTVEIDMESTETGKIYAPAGTLTNIVTAESGIDSITNPTDADLGRPIETNAELKTRRAAQISTSGSSNDDGIAAAIVNEVENVIEARVRSNRKGYEVNGQPANSYTAYVRGGDDQEIADKIWEVGNGGIQPYGDIEVTVVDRNGEDQTVGFSRITEQSIEAEITLQRNTDSTEGLVYPSNGDEQVKDALVAYFANFTSGRDIINSQTYTPINTIPGIKGIVAKYAFLGGVLTEDNISVPFDKYARIEKANIVVN
jgi:uncharacterized phage protein gp47/JayE